MYPPSAILRVAGVDPEMVRRSLDLPDLDLIPLRPAPRWMRRAWGREVGAMTVPWAIYVDPVLLAGDADRLASLVVHELVHARQWRQRGILGFLRRYLGAYLGARLGGAGHRDAYEAIPAEREARALTAALMTEVRRFTPPPRR